MSFHNELGLQIMAKKQEIVDAIASEYSSLRSSSNQQSINIQKIQLFMQQKQDQLNNLQKFLITQFESMQRFKDVKQKLCELLSQKIKSFFLNIKSQFTSIISQYSLYYKCFSSEWAQFTSQLLLDKQQKIQMLELQLIHRQQLLRSEIQKNKTIQKQNLNLNGKLESMKLQKKMQLKLDTGNNLFRNKSSHNMGYKGEQQSKLSIATSSKNLGNYSHNCSHLCSHICSQNESQNQNSNRKYIRQQKSSLNLGLQQSKNISSVSSIPVQRCRLSPVKWLMKQVQRNLKQESQNQRLQVERKRYVKQKISQIKHRGLDKCVDTKISHNRF